MCTTVYFPFTGFQKRDAGLSLSGVLAIMGGKMFRWPAPTEARRAAIANGLSINAPSNG
jgi:hypothetical protein